MFIYALVVAGIYSEGIPALQTERQTQVTGDLVLERESMQYLLFSIFPVKHA